MTASAGAASTTRFADWNSIDWDTVESQVKRLQMRIAKAWREKRMGKVKALQRLLTHSYFAKLLAVRRVTQNKGKNTPGIDGVIWISARDKMKAALSLKRRSYRPLPLRRIYIPKKSGQKRPLGIPCMHDRAVQALHLLALEPVAEMLADQDSYGFRPHRSCADAIEQCFLSLAKRYSPGWILEGDIKSCFDKICHSWLLKNTPMDVKILERWLKAGYMEQTHLHPTFEGTPQGGIISPTLLCVTLAGLQRRISEAVTTADQVNVIIYADDFVVTGRTREVLENKVRPVVEEFLKERGLELSKEKTKITHIQEGFDFLGFNIRKYGKKLLIKPSKASVLAFCRRLRGQVKQMPTESTEDLIRTLNPKIRGWANYFRHSVAKDVYSYVDFQIFKAVWRWCKRRHPTKPRRWIRTRYFRYRGIRAWQFSTKRDGLNGKEDYDLINMSDIKIRRHIKIRKAANPYDPQYFDYLKKRSRSKMVIGQSRLMERHQSGECF